MANPKRKHTRSRRDKRRATWTIATKLLSKCSNCGALKLSHHVCSQCGFYNSELVLAPKIKKTKESEQQPGASSQK